MAAPVAVAEFVCRSEVSYSWVRVAASEREGAPQGTPAVVAGTPVPEQLKVRFIELERAGKDEGAAKAALEAEVGRQKVRASEVCLRQHEALGSCVAIKLSSNGSILNALGFSARAELEKALTAECRAQQGRCLGVEAATPTCREVVSAQPTAAADEKKGDAKKKK